MAASQPPAPGQIGWVDLTVPDAVGVRDFYAQVTGWTASGLDLGGYEDFCMSPPDAAAPVAGICHNRGGNAGLPPVWLIYIMVADLDESVRRCTEHGGKVLKEPAAYGDQGRYCIIEDPAGAVAGLYQSLQ